jgi:glycosyltransferase involved in cell wall biosynthesis
MDIDGMAGRIISLLRNPSQAQKMGAKARERAFERYDADGYTEKWVSVWEKAVELGMRTGKHKSTSRGKSSEAESESE